MRYGIEVQSITLWILGGLASLSSVPREWDREFWIAARVGTGFAVLFAIVGVLAFSPLLFLLALFIYGAASSESRAVMLGELLDGLSVGDLLADTDAVSLDTTVDRILPRLLGARRSELPVVDAGGTVVGVISRTDYSAVLALRQGKEPF